MHAACFSHILTIVRHYYILSKTMVDMRQRYVVVICEISQILQMSLQCSIVCLLCLIYLFVALLKHTTLLLKLLKLWAFVLYRLTRFIYVYACSLDFTDFNLLLDCVCCQSYYSVCVCNCTFVIWQLLINIIFFCAFPAFHFYSTRDNCISIYWVKEFLMFRCT